MKNKLRVTDLITIDEVENWKAEDCITIKAGTGTGKSYFIKNTLYDVAKRQNKRILMLIHRSNCIEQFINEITRDKKHDVIDIKTYQKLEYKELNTYINDLSEYQYICCDEFHYFMGDASFSKTTDMSLDLILSQTFATKIFMSATGDKMKTFINKVKNIKTIDYELPINFEFINDLLFFNTDDTFEILIEDAIKRNEKSIFFIQSAKKAYKLFKKYEDYCLFNCSKNNKTYYKYIDKDKIKNMLINEKFEELILITTTCMDAGVNLIDVDLRHIICEVEDTGTLIQCIGRKRIQNEYDNINVYLKIINNNSLGGKETQLKKKIHMAEFLKTHTVKEFITKFPRQYDYSNIVYDDIVLENNKGTKKINELMYYKTEEDLCEIQIIKEFGKYGYCEYLKNLFGVEFYSVIEEQNKTNELKEYLDSIIGKKLYKDEQKELIEKIDLKVNRRLQKSYDKLNDGLKMINLNYMILPKKSNNNRYWIVERFEI